MPDLQRTTEGTTRSTESAHATVARSFLALGSGEALARVIAFGAMLLVAHRLGAEGLGVVSLSAAVLLYLSRVVDAGFDMGIGIREASVRRDTLGEFIPAILTFRLLLAGIVGGIAGVASLSLLPAPEGLVVALYCLTLIPMALSARWALTGLDRTTSAGIARAAGELAVFMTIAILVHGPVDLWRVPLAQLIGDALAAIIVLVGLRRLGVAVGLRWNGAIVQPLVARHITPYVGSTLLGIVLFNADVIFLRIFRDATTVGLYASAYALVSFLLNIGGTYALTLLPSLTRLAPDPSTRQQVFEEAAAKVFLVILPVTIGGAMIAAEFLAVVYGAEFSAAGPVLAVLLVSAPLSLLRAVATTAIMAERKEGALLRIVGISAAANIVLNLVVVPRWGMTGAAVVTVVTELLRLVLSQYYATSLGFAVPRATRLWKPVVAGGLMALLLATPIGKQLWLAIPVAAAAYGFVLMILGALKFRRDALPELRV
jgi:O-antigen/teichoic acid export membrane protein